MQSIGIVDDREDVREGTELAINLALRRMDRDWNVVAVYPFEKMEEYIAWIKDNSISVLLIDERLQEEPSGLGATVQYKGHDLTMYLRGFFKEFPMYVLTAYKDDADLQDKFKHIDGIISRRDFDDKEEDYLTQILRAANRFLDENRIQLNKISELSKKIAKGEGSKEDSDELASLQSFLEIPYSNPSLNTKSQWLNQFDEAVKDMDDLKNKLEEFLKQQ